MKRSLECLWYPLMQAHLGYMHLYIGKAEITGLGYFCHSSMVLPCMKFTLYEDT